MQNFLAELLGTMLLVLLGDGVVANVVLTRTKGQNSGWIVITVGWGVAVAMAVYAVGRLSGAHLNPAVTIGLASIGSFPWSDAPAYIAAQLIGAFTGSVLVWLAYLPHWPATSDPDLKLAVFSTGPAIRRPISNLVTEIIGTAVLLFGVLAIAANAQTLSKPGDVDLTFVRYPAAARWHPRGWNRCVARRTDRVCDQSGTRSRATSGPCAPAHSREGDVRLGLRMGAHCRTDHRGRGWRRLVLRAGFLIDGWA